MLGEVQQAIEYWKERHGDDKTIRAALFQLKKLDSWCKKRGWKIQISWNIDPESNFETKTVTLDKNNPIAAIHFLLHECGHILMGFNPSHIVEHYGKDYHKRSIKTKDFIAKLGRIQEEMEAWNLGAKLAKELGLSINKKKFDETRARALKTYIKWAMKK